MDENVSSTHPNAYRVEAEQKRSEANRLYAEAETLLDKAEEAEKDLVKRGRMTAEEAAANDKSEEEQSTEEESKDKKKK
jgi:hypothetical protein